jgi:uncharacterized protein (DUF305 family)
VDEISDQETKKSGQAIWRTLSTITALILVILVTLVALNLRNTIPPGEGSAEVGFARDMIVHHAQAVEMALLLYDRTENDALRAIAADIMLGQQAQIGQMQGWLILWGVPIANIERPMTWMEMAVDGLMPGMATDEQLAALRASTGIESDRLFIELMIPHNDSGIHMAQAVLDRSQHPVVGDLARAIINAQQREINELRLLAEKLGANVPESTEEHDH